MSIPERRRELIKQELDLLLLNINYEILDTVENISLIMQASHELELEQRYAGKFPVELLGKN